MAPLTIQPKKQDIRKSPRVRGWRQQGRGQQNLKKGGCKQYRGVLHQIEGLEPLRQL